MAMEFGAQLIVLDSLHDLFAGDENARPQARQFTNLLRGLAIAQDAVVLVNAHPSLGGMKTGSGFSGSTSWNNAVRSRLYLRRPKKDEAGFGDGDLRILESMKSNYGRVGMEIPLRWHRGMFVPLDEKGSVSSVNEQENAERVFLVLLSKREAQGRPASPRPRADNYGPRIFARHYDCSGFTKRDLESAMERLFDQGRIKVTQYGERPSRMFEKIVPNVASDEG